MTTLDLNSILDEDLLSKIKKIGFSRIPISYDHEGNLLVGVFLTKSLVSYIPKDETIAQAIKKGHL